MAAMLPPTPLKPETRLHPPPLGRATISTLKWRYHGVKRRVNGFWLPIGDLRRWRLGSRMNTRETGEKPCARWGAAQPPRRSRSAERTPSRASASRKRSFGIETNVGIPPDSPSSARKLRPLSNGAANESVSVSRMTAAPRAPVPSGAGASCRSCRAPGSRRRRRSSGPSAAPLRASPGRRSGSDGRWCASPVRSRRARAAARSIWATANASASPPARWRTMSPRSAVSRPRAPDSAIEPLRRRARCADARVDRARVVVGARVRLDAPRSHLAAEQSPSKSVWQTRVSTFPVRRTSSGVTISGQAPCSAFVARTKPRVALRTPRGGRGRGDRPTRRSRLPSFSMNGLVDLGEPAPRRIGGERDVEHDHAPLQLVRFRELPRGGERDLGARVIQLPPVGRGRAGAQTATRTRPRIASTRGMAKSRSSSAETG